MHKVGAKRIGVVGVPPIGCMPIVMTFTGDGIHCVDKMNKAVLSLNSKIQKQMEAIRTQLNMKTIFVDVYNIIESAINNPKKYGKYLNYNISVPQIFNSVSLLVLHFFGILSITK